jgi:hypothetical protein
MQPEPRPQLEDLDELTAAVARLEGTAEALDARLDRTRGTGGAAAAGTAPAAPGSSRA